MSVCCQAVGSSACDISLRIEFEKPGLVGHHSGLVVAIPLMLLLDDQAILDCHLVEHLVDTSPPPVVGALARYIVCHVTN